MRILVLLPRFPYPLEKGDKLRAYHQIKDLSAQHEIHLFALSHNRVGDEAMAEMQRYCKSIKVAHLSMLYGAMRVMRNMVSVKSLQIGFWDSKKAQKQLRKYAEQVQPDVVYAQMIRTLKYAAHLPFPKVIDFQDALSMNQERRMMSHRGLRYFVLHYEFKMLRSAEFNACSIFDGHTIISETDRDALPQHHDTQITIVRNGVDFDYFHPMDMPKDYDVVFCGNMQYKPNIDASRFLVEEVMPLVWQHHPEARVMLAGATPTKTVRQLAGPRVTVTGSVPDIRPCYAQSKIFVAPMRIGSGLQNKILEAMSMQVPCVTTPMANLSIGATDGTDLLLGQDAQQLADAICRLLDDPDLRNRLVANAAQFVHQHFSWQAANQVLEQVLTEAIHKHATHEEQQLEVE